ncbi:GNAT family N-acetyltransferase [Paenibacillus sp. ACRRX]|uniref:GNAT family N-acetyltransferase n=1 Tax=Paenibacillus sp. ACRRX TaxID=2918206 RepID=UPI001EF6E664|nr:GNAT family N-acetyltransferase [Paenibacillus sp. ACRRX]MCG7408707.1 GNAT family N-acetyltransferase [Paenibacillus sp. ACRRX]
MSLHINIVNYHPDYGDSIAEMWNRSQSEWGGGTTVMTGAQVRQNEAVSDWLALFLAVAGDEVVGYCSLTEYKEDTGALHIQLLNVRPDYHGMKVGKMLVLRAVEETIRRGWPRIDLYTWGANLKAVPLYKRCGYFWEDREDTTHFMNFVPQIVNCEAIAPYMKGIDWYADSTRIIEVIRDGQVDNGFHTYTYAWKNKEKELRVDIERRGRGICLIETEDYLLSATAEQAEPVFGKEYTVQYRIVNKSGKPLRIDFKGESDRNVTFNWEQSVEVSSEQRLTARFFVDVIDKEQSEWRTCPTVRANVLINGLEAVIQVGIVPKFPAAVALKIPNEIYALGGQYDMYLDIENHFPECASFTFELTPTPWLELEQHSYTVNLQPKERASLPFPFRLLDYGFYSQQLKVVAATTSGDEVTFNRRIGGGFSGPGGMCYGETDTAHLAMNGKYGLEYEKDSNQLRVHCLGRDSSLIALSHPKIGKPYSAEFSKKQAESVKWKQERGAVGFQHTYRSGEFAQLLLHTHALLHADGTIKLWQELENDSLTATSEQMWITQRIRKDLYRSVLPYEGRIVEMGDSHGDDFDYWDGDKITEPWLFARGDGLACGICWSDTHQMSLQSYFIDLETNMGILLPGAKRRSDDLILTVGSFDNWQDFRSYALKRAKANVTSQTVRHVTLTANGGNPFVQPDMHKVQAILRDTKQNAWEGTVSASYAANGKDNTAVTTVSLGGEAAEVQLEMAMPATPIDTMCVKAVLGSFSELHQRTLFTLAANDVTSTSTHTDVGAMYEASNGPISIKVNADYYPGLHSLMVNDREWFDSSYPTYGVKSWWNPWIGGMTEALDELGPLSVLKEDRSVTSARLTDSVGNTWSGLRVRLSVSKHSKYRGLIWDSYYLMLPGVPVLAYVTDIYQNTGTYLTCNQAATDIFLDLPQGWLLTSDAEGQPLHYPLGEGELAVREHRDYVFGSKDNSGVLQLVTDESLIQPQLYTNKDVNCLTLNRELSLPHDSITRSTPTFMVFADDVLPRESLRELRGITFPQAAKGEEA